MIDSHCHLDHEPLFSNINEVIRRSKEIGVKKILTISTNLKSFENIKKIIEIDSIIYGTIGIHPHESSKDIVKSDYIIDNAKKYEKIIGVGETGLDFYYENSKKKDQIDSFTKHIEASISLDYPLIVHSRNAEKETFDILNQYKNSNIKILMHCFTGSKEFAKKLMNLNAYFSASGIITFKKNKDLTDTFKSIPNPKGTVMASDAFFPFRDGIDEAAKVGVTAVIQPGGSVRDQEVIDAADEHNIAMLFTGMRHFKH